MGHGAVGYLVKRFSWTELSARIRAALRKRLASFPSEPSRGSYVVNGLTIGCARLSVLVAGEQVELTAAEYAVLYELAVHAPRVLTQRAAVACVGFGADRRGRVGWGMF